MIHRIAAAGLAAALAAGGASAQSLSDALSGIVDIRGADPVRAPELCALPPEGWQAALGPLLQGRWTLREGRGVVTAHGYSAPLPASGLRAVTITGDGGAALAGLGRARLLAHPVDWPFGDAGLADVPGGTMLSTALNTLPPDCASASLPRLSARGEGGWRLWLYLRSPGHAQGALVTEARAADGTTKRLVRLVDLHRGG